MDSIVHWQWHCFLLLNAECAEKSRNTRKNRYQTGMSQVGRRRRGPFSWTRPFGRSSWHLHRPAEIGPISGRRWTVPEDAPKGIHHEKGMHSTIFRVLCDTSVSSAFEFHGCECFFYPDSNVMESIVHLAFTNDFNLFRSIGRTPAIIITTRRTEYRCESCFH